MTECDVVIVGAGAAGIAAGRHLKAARPSLGVQILEARDRVGGRARTEIVEGLPLDLGCEWFHGAQDNEWAKLAAALGLPIAQARASWDSTQRHYGLNPEEAREARTALFDFYTRAETLAQAERDAPLSAALEPGGRWNHMIDAIGTYINGVELDGASLKDFDNYEPGRGPDTRPEQGYGALVVSQAAALPIRCGVAARRIDHGGTAVTVETDAGALRCRAVIVTVSTNILAGGRLRFTPDLPDKRVAAARLPLGLDNKLFLFLPEPDRFEVESHLMGSATRSGTGAYHVRPFGRPIIGGYFGGRCARELESAGPGAYAAFAMEELTAHFGAAAMRGVRPLACSAWGTETWIGGAYSYAVPGAAGDRALLGTSVDDRLFFAGEAVPPAAFSTAHGAFRSGVTAAEGVLTALA